MTDIPTIINESEVEWENESHGERFASRRKALGATANGEKLGVMTDHVHQSLNPARK